LALCKSLGKKPLILLNTGSYCPPHFGHFSSLLKAKEFLEQTQNYKVLALYYSPSSDTYVKSKARLGQFEHLSFNFEERCEMLEETKRHFEGEVDILVDRWEGYQPKFIHFNNVWVSLQYYMDQLFRDQDIRVEVACCLGADMLKTNIDLTFNHLRLDKETYNLPLVICGREGNHSDSILQKIYKYSNMSYEDMKNKNLFYVPGDDQQMSSMSSTLIRKDTISNRKSQNLRTMVDPLVKEKLASRLNNFVKNSRDYAFSL